MPRRSVRKPRLGGLGISRSLAKTAMEKLFAFDLPAGILHDDARESWRRASSMARRYGVKLLGSRGGDLAFVGPYQAVRKLVKDQFDDEMLEFVGRYTGPAL